MVEQDADELDLYRRDWDRYVEHAIGRPGEPLKLTEPFQAVLDPADLRPPA